MQIHDYLRLCVDHKASDIHFTENSPAIVRVDGRLKRLDTPVLSTKEIKDLIYGVLTDAQKAKFEETWELDFSLASDGCGRFRVNVHKQRGSIEAALRHITEFVPDMDDLGLPDAAIDLARKPNGLVLVTGITGSGKTTTLASIIDVINRERDCMIITIEDPIEYVHQNKRAVVKQRELFSDTFSFSEALKRCLRQDPDVIVVGEMRDLETISTALTAAETGHLVLATLHTSDAPQTIERMIDVFPPHQQQQVRVQLSVALQGIIAQKLLPHASGEGRVLATEVLVATPAIRNLIREQAIEQIPTSIQTGSQYGMHTMDMSLKKLYQAGVITYEEAFINAIHKDEIERLLGED